MVNFISASAATNILMNELNANKKNPNNESGLFFCFSASLVFAYPFKKPDVIFGSGAYMEGPLITKRSFVVSIFKQNMCRFWKKSIV